MRPLDAFAEDEAAAVCAPVADAVPAGVAGETASAISPASDAIAAAGMPLRRLRMDLPVLPNPLKALTSVTKRSADSE
jgi:hypothetical protein